MKRGKQKTGIIFFSILMLAGVSKGAYFEAEDASLTGVLTTVSAPASRGYRTTDFGQSGDSITFNNVPAATYLKIHYSLGVAASPLSYPENMIRQCGVYVDVVRVETVTFDPTSDWDNGWQETVVPINTTGSSTIKLQVDASDATANKSSGDDSCSVDYVEVLDYITLPIQNRAFRHEDTQFGYSTLFNRNVPQFDVNNRAYIRGRNIDDQTIPGYVHVLQDNGTWIQRDFFGAIQSVYPQFSNTVDGGGEDYDSTVVFDTDNDAYQILRMDSPNKTLLLYSKDQCQTWQIYELPDKAYRIERPTNTSRLSGPPALVSKGGSGQLALSLTTITKSGVNLVLSGLKTFTPNNTLGIKSHSGGTHHAITISNKVHLVWSEDTTGSVPIKTCTYNKTTDTFSSTVTIMNAQPAGDSHVTPSMVVDSQGYLHVISGSHQDNPFYYAKSINPDSTASWSAPTALLTGGMDGPPNMTYPAFICDDEDTLHLIYRNGRKNDGTDATTLFGAVGNQHKYMVHQRKKAGEAWETDYKKLTRLVAPVFSSYAGYKQKLTIDKNGSLYLSYSYHSNNTSEGTKNYPDPDDGTQLYKYRALLVSHNHGDTWHLAKTADFLSSLNNDALPASPTGLAAASKSNGSIELTWSNVSGTFNVYRRNYSGGHAVQVAAGLGSSAYVDPHVNMGDTYYYAVSVVGTNGMESHLSNEAAATSTTVSVVLDFNAVADTYRDQYSPGSNFGSETRMKVRNNGSKQRDGYLKFNVSGLQGSVSSATLKVYAQTGVANVIASSVADTSWGESTLTWNNAPVIGGALDTVTGVSAGQWVELDVTAAITGNGTYSFAVSTSDGTNGREIATRETANDPVLEVSYSNPVSPYEQWSDLYGLVGSNTNLTANPDGDSLDNLMEYGLGGNPTISDDAALLPQYAMEQEGGTNWVEYIYRRRLDAGDRGLTYALQLTSDLVSGSWSTNGYAKIGAGTVDSDFESVTNRISTAGKTNEFIRLSIEINE